MLHHVAAEVTGVHGVLMNQAAVTCYNVTKSVSTFPERSGTAPNDEPWRFLAQTMAGLGENHGSLCLNVKNAGVW